MVRLWAGLAAALAVGCCVRPAAADDGFAAVRQVIGIHLARLIDDDESSRVTERLDGVYVDAPSELDTGLAALQALAIDEDW